MTIRTVKVSDAEIVGFGYKIISRHNFDPAIHTLHPGEHPFTPDEIAEYARLRSENRPDKYVEGSGG